MRRSVLFCLAFLAGTQAIPVATIAAEPTGMINTPAMTPAARALLAAEDKRFRAEQMADLPTLDP